MQARKLQADGQLLFCAALIFHKKDRYGRVTMTPKLEYFHADDIVHARNIVRCMYQDRSKVTISEVGPVVGVWAPDEDDKHGNLYTVT